MNLSSYYKKNLIKAGVAKKDIDLWMNSLQFLPPRSINNLFKLLEENKIQNIEEFTQLIRDKTQALKNGEEKTWSNIIKRQLTKLRESYGA